MRFAGLGENRIMVVNLPIPPQKGITDEEYEVVSRLFDQAAYFQLNPRLQILASALSGELQQYPNDMILARACGNTLLSAIRHQINNKDVRSRGNHLDIDKLRPVYRAEFIAPCSYRSVGKLLLFECQPISRAL